MTSSETRRQEALDIVYSALSNPDASGNRFLSQLMNNAKDGYFSLNLLKGLVTELKDYPLAYLQHCISYQQRHHPNQSQLELGHDESQVRISRRDGNITPVTEPETDPFGFLIKHSSSTTTEETGEKRPSSPATELSTTSASSASEIHPPLPKKQRRSSGTYFTPYRPSFNFTALAEDEGSLDLLPVFYADGKFFQDDSFFNASKAEKATKTIPFYNKLEALPIGMDQVKDVQTGSLIKEKTCWNCGSPGHEIPKCPIPIDRQRVETNRAIHSTNNGFSGGGRYYEELVYKDRVSGLEPGRLSAHLRDALGMYNYEDDPPYYRAMRKHGYPPGYTGTYADQERVMKLVSGNQLDEDVPDLKIFDLDCDGEDGDKDKSAEQDQNGNDRLCSPNFE
ncbi:hypothetical protein BCR42DRAFT_240478 [Absidia repens]|uniref:CCHC-type domain-containing protein n=1 Tax=Absidia repens TaxID=90262 RepID=A0A1X2IJU6_9FUNG|nr:hypothetical protein BCR42DRAFT_240478 [Absidia repens]